MSFNKEHFFAHKQGIRENMEANLIWDKHHGTLKHKSSKYNTTKYIEILFTAPKEELLGKMEFITGMIRDGVKIEQYEISETPYCTKHLKGVRYAYPVTTLREKIEDRQVTSAMQHLVRKKLIEEARKYVSVDCSVMDLFKTGKIDWDTVIESHKKDCSV